VTNDAFLLGSGDAGRLVASDAGLSVTKEDCAQAASMAAVRTTADN